MSRTTHTKWNQSTEDLSSLEGKEPMVPQSVLLNLLDLLNEFVTQVEEVCHHYVPMDIEDTGEAGEDTPTED